MITGIIARFRTMAIARGSVLSGHVGGGAMIQTTFPVAVLLGTSVMLGHRPRTGVIDWLSVVALLGSSRSP